jgi:hypothetical protein
LTTAGKRPKAATRKDLEPLTARGSCSASVHSARREEHSHDAGDEDPVEGACTTDRHDGRLEPANPAEVEQVRAEEWVGADGDSRDRDDRDPEQVVATTR